MLNYFQVINVCKICDVGFDKQGYKVENSDNYEIDLFICPNCRKNISKKVDKSLFGKETLTSIDKSIKRQFRNNKLKRKINKLFKKYQIKEFK